jgi:hypothetical protein
MVNGKKIFTLDFTEQELNVLAKYLATPEYLERHALISAINSQMSEQQKSTAPLSAKRKKVETET